MLTDKQKEDLEAKIRLAVPGSMKHEWFPMFGRSQKAICVNCALVEKEETDKRRWSRKCNAGRPLNLQDLLITLDARGDRMTEEEGHGAFADTILAVINLYDLTKDLFHEDNEPVRVLAHSLLCDAQ